MIRTLTASTSEIDDENLAVKEILSQLNMKDALLTNSIGIIACHYEFVMSDIISAVCNALPFDVVGTISNVQSVDGNAGALLFTVMVITSDDSEFIKVVTPSLASDSSKHIAESYQSVSRAENPALILTFAPFMPQNSGDEYVAAISEVSGNTPCFGTLAVDDTNSFENCFTICNGEHFADKMIIVLIYGNISPKFFIANISPDYVMDKSVVVTKSHRHVLMEVNNRPVSDFFNELGLTSSSEVQYAMSSLPFLLDYNDGTPPVAKIVMLLTPEKYALCAGAVPEGSTFNLCITDKHDVLLTTGQALDKIIEEGQNASGLLVYSCISRLMAMGGTDPLQEAHLINAKLSGKIPFLAAHSGGEICPTQNSNNKAINRFHNNTLIACLF